GRVPRSDAPAPAADLCGVAVEAHVHRLQGPVASSSIIVFHSLSREGCSKSDRFQDGWILNMGGWRMSGLDGREAAHVQPSKLPASAPPPSPSPQGEGKLAPSQEPPSTRRRAPGRRTAATGGSAPSSKAAVRP